MNRIETQAAALVAALLVAACADGTKKPDAAAVTAVSPAKPVAPARAVDDMYRYVNGPWLATEEIPADRSSWGAFVQLRDNALTQLHDVIDEAGRAGPRATADQRKVADLYASFMDEARIDALGAKPVASSLRAIDAMQSKREIPGTIARLQQLGIATPLQMAIGLDPRDPKRYIPTLYQSGLGMPDREYYLRDDDVKLKDARVQYVAHVERLLALAGVPHAAVDAQNVLAIETALARAQWTRVENRDPVKTYNKVALSSLATVAPGFGWKAWADDTRLTGKVQAVVIAQPSYVAAFARAVDTMPLDAWQSYFRYRVVSSAAPLMSRAFVDESFAFHGKVLSGTPTDMPRWKRGVGIIESSMGQGLGRLYVAKYFPPEYKARMDALVKNLLAAYRTSIDGLDWMSRETKREAQAKLAKFTPKIAYPARWRDYGALTVRSDDLMGNLQRARRFEYDRNLAKLGKPIDRLEWSTTPQTVNAYYSGQRNEIVFPAGILQPPFFDPKADDATNYGAIGAVIGHEISHGFDDRGSQSDGDGRLRNWWTNEDRKRFDTKTRALIAQYDAFEPLPGYHVNGALTLGENIADNSGIAVAYRAYRIALGSKVAPVVDGLSGDQRFYVGFTRLWRNKMRDAQRIQLIKTDPHSPGEYRANGTLRNQAPFYPAFDVKPGDGMYLAPEKRVVIW